MDQTILYLASNENPSLNIRTSRSTLQEYEVKTRMTTIETRFDTILQTLATKEDLKNFEVKLTGRIHHEVNTSTWRMIVWMTAVIGLAFTGIFYIARCVPA